MANYVVSNFDATEARLYFGASHGRNVARRQKAARAALSLDPNGA